MPLLGRLKSASSSQRSSKNSPPAQNVQAQAQAQARPTQQPQVCESPLFGMRSQLPLWSGLQIQQQQQQKQEPAKCDELSSVPQQISKQQIHYAFTMMDTNKDGLIDFHDLSQMLANLGLPIDKAILSYVMSSVSKRGDQRISEDEFLAWISNFIQISDSLPAEKIENSQLRSGQLGSSSGGRKSSRVARSFTSVSSLAAQPGAEQLTRTSRRGSGSGLALMRSLSSSSANTSATPSSSSNTNEKLSRKASSEEVNSVDAEARNDLKAAFCVFDLDGDGFITLDEVRAGLRLLGESSWSTLELHHLFSRCPSSSSSSSSSSDLSRQQQQQRISIDDFVQLLL